MAPSPSFSVTRSPADDRITVDPNYIIQPEVKPENLYAYTDPNAKIETLYAWTNSTYNATIYTNTTLPTTSGPFYDASGNDRTYLLNNADCGVNNATSSAISWRVGGKGYTIVPTSTEVPLGVYTYDRDSSKDIQLGNPTTVYTDSTTLTTGMTLYDNTGTDTGLTIGTVNQDSSFDIIQTSRTLTITNSQNSFINPTPYTVTDQDGNTILIPTYKVGDIMTGNVSNSVTSIIITNLTSGNPETTGKGLYDFSVINCTATLSGEGGYYSNTLTLSNFTGDPSVTLTFGYGPK